MKPEFTDSEYHGLHVWAITDKKPFSRLIREIIIGALRHKTKHGGLSADIPPSVDGTPRS